MDNYSFDRRFKPYTGDQERGNASFLEKDVPVDYKHPESSNLYKECPRCLFTSDIAEIGETQCNYCDIHDQLERNSKPQNLWSDLYKIQRRGKAKRHDCIIGISGGLDSSLLLYLAVKKWGLHPLVIHFDNGYNNAQAEANIKNLVEKLNVNFIKFYLDKSEYDNLNLAFLEAGVPDADIPNDIAMTKLMYQTADQYGIKWILNGHDFRQEGSTPAKWTFMGAEYISDVYEKFMNYPLENYPLLTLKDQIWKYSLKQILTLSGPIRQIRPFHYGFDREPLEAEMKDFIGWQDYGGKHCENIYTEYVGAHLLPVKFGIDKRIVYLSARVRSGKLKKDEAKLILQTKTLFDMNKFTDPVMRSKIAVLSRSDIQPRENFKLDNYKKYKWLIWLMAKMKIVPYTFYRKYCK